MVLPIILGALALGAGGFGVSKGLEGAGALGKAQKEVERSKERYKKRKKQFDSRIEYVNAKATHYGTIQQSIKEDVFLRVATLIEEIGKRAKVDLYEMLEGVDIQVPSLGTNGDHNIKAESIFQGILTAAGASFVSSTATTGAVTWLATAGTGAAISGLSGAAANSALLAALGGGSLAAGGGGMALGSLVLGGLTVAPIIAVGGLAVASEGEKALTKALEFECEVKKAIAEIELRESALGGIIQRLDELSGLLIHLRSLATKALKRLEDMVSADLFDSSRNEDIECLRSLLLVVSAIAQIMKTAILTDDGSINPEIDVVIKKATI